MNELVDSMAIARYLASEHNGERTKIGGVSEAGEAKPNTITFLVENATPPRGLEEVPGLLVIAHSSHKSFLKGSYVLSENPKLDYARVVRHFLGTRSPALEGVAETARIGASVKMGSSCSVGEYSVIDGDVVIGDNATIGHHVVIEGPCRVGNDCAIEPHVMIGNEGFGFAFDEERKPLRVPHRGRVVLGDRVEVGSGSVIAKGTIGDTTINSDVKINVLVRVAHNVTIGEGSIIAGGTINGSTVIGAKAWLAPGCVIRNKVRLGENVTVGLGAVVTKSYGSDETLIGNPAKPVKS